MGSVEFVWGSQKDMEERLYLSHCPVSLDRAKASSQTRPGRRGTLNMHDYIDKKVSPDRTVEYIFYTLIHVWDNPPSHNLAIFVPVLSILVSALLLVSNLAVNQEP